MKNIRPTDEQIIEAWRRTRNAAEVGRELGVSRQIVTYRILRLRAEGMELPPAQPPGYVLTSARAREIAKLAVRRAAKWTPERRKALSDALKQRNTGAKRPDGRADETQ